MTLADLDGFYNKLKLAWLVEEIKNKNILDIFQHDNNLYFKIIIIQLKLN